MTTTRREFITASLGCAVTLYATLAANRDARADEKLNEADPAAKAVGYVADAAKVDKGHFPAYKAGQTCNNCSLFQGSPKMHGAAARCSAPNRLRAVAGAVHIRICRRRVRSVSCYALPCMSALSRVLNYRSCPFSVVHVIGLGCMAHALRKSSSVELQSRD